MTLLSRGHVILTFLMLFVGLEPKRLSLHRLLVLKVYGKNKITDHLAPI